MGIVAKTISKRQAAPQTGPVNTGLPKDLPWLTNEYLVVSALLRSACLGLGLSGTKSITARGSTSIFTPAFASSLWCETVNALRWRFYLGVIGADQQMAADWVLELAINDGVATVTTPNYLTRDGKLEHSNLHSALRERLLHALAFGAPDVGSLEAQASTAALSRIVTPRLATVPPAGGKIAIRTQLAQPAIARALSLVGLPVVSWSPTAWRWGLGLQPHAGRDWLALQATFDGKATVVEGELRLHDTAPVLHRRVAYAAARTWLQRAEFLLRQQDSALDFKGPRLMADGE